MQLKDHWPFLTWLKISHCLVSSSVGSIGLQSVSVLRVKPSRFYCNASLLCSSDIVPFFLLCSSCLVLLSKLNYFLSGLKNHTMYWSYLLNSTKIPYHNDVRIILQALGYSTHMKYAALEQYEYPYGIKWQELFKEGVYKRPWNKTHIHKHPHLKVQHYFIYFTQWCT